MTDPPGRWVMTQRGHDVLFAHWRVKASDLRGRPGVWFFSLDAESSLAAIGGSVRLPSFRATMHMSRDDERIGYTS